MPTTGTPAGGIPVYILAIGQSNAEGNGDDANMDDGFQGPVEGVRIWNHAANEAQFLVHSKDGSGSARNNLTTVGEFFGGGDDTPLGTPANLAEEGPQIGPEMSLAPMLRQRHPDALFVLLFKYCVGNSIVGNFGVPPSGATLNQWRKDFQYDDTTKDNYGQMVSRWDICKDQLYNTQFAGQITGFNIQAVFSVIGESDAGGGTASPQIFNPSNFYTNMSQVIADFRDDFVDTTHTSADPIPFILAKAHPGIDPALVGGLVKVPAFIATVRAAQEQLADDLLNVVAVETSDLEFETPDLFGFPRLHYTAPSQEKLGQRLGSALSKVYPPGSAVGQGVAGGGVGVGAGAGGVGQAVGAM